MTIYKYLVGPILKQHKQSIQAFIDEIKGSASDVATHAKSEAAKQLNDPANLIKAANLANQAQEQLNRVEQWTTTSPQ